MALTHKTKWFAVVDAKISPLTADPEGGAATYGASIDVPGIKSVGITPGIASKELRGDNKRLDVDVSISGIRLQFAHAKLSLDALAVLLGGSVLDSGVTPAQKARYRHLGASRPGYWKFEAQAPSVDVIGGDGHIIAYKCIVTGYELGNAEENYRTFSGTAETMARLADDVWVDIDINETAVAIA